MTWVTSSNSPGIASYPGFWAPGRVCSAVLLSSTDFTFITLSSLVSVLVARVQLFATPWTVAWQIPLPTEFSRQEYWNGLRFPSPGDLPDPGFDPGLLHCEQILYHLSRQGSRCGLGLWEFSFSIFHSVNSIEDWAFTHIHVKGESDSPCFRYLMEGGLLKNI